MVSIRRLQYGITLLYGYDLFIKHVEATAVSQLKRLMYREGVSPWELRIEEITGYVEVLVPRSQWYHIHFFPKDRNQET